MNYDRPELRDRLAAEYVLGTLHGRARRRFQRLLDGDAQLREAVEFWQRELVPMAAPLSVPVPPPRVWDGIAARVGPRGAPRPSWFERWFSTRMLGSLATGLFIGVGVATLVPALLDRGDPDAVQTQLPQSYAGILNAADGRPTMLVSSLRHGRIADIKVLRPVALRDDQVLQLWALPAAGAPIPLGNVPRQGKGKVELPATSEQLLANVAELAVSVESRRAAPPTAPAGAFLLRGPCAKFW